ncbi:T9SS type A sorting domain-containing protein [Aquimarina sp. 2201CG1-2-11]|uniref:T9SS type A sorting domain-containing protein n=1 Tax=Aquimarina discodermiae TaxID=3231043 RepID=UPI0034625509
MKVTIIKPKQIIWVYFILFGVNQIKGQTVKDHHSDQTFESNETKEVKPENYFLMEQSFEFESTKNPKTNKIPEGIREAEIRFSKTIPEGSFSKSNIQASKNGKSSKYYYWKNRGPYNLGDETVVLAIDTSNENVIFAGGNHSGLWRSKNGGKSWRNVFPRKTSPNVSSLLQDPRSGKQHIWYMGTGLKLNGSSLNPENVGSGLFKSYNGGKSWFHISSTFLNLSSKTLAFDVINNMVINPINGDLYVAAYDGIYRSKDSGRSFEQVLESGNNSFTRIAITSKGKLYVSIARGDVAKGYYTSTSGDSESWQDITPKFLKNKIIGRAIIEIDPSRENIVYFLSGSEIWDKAYLFKFDDNSSKFEDAWTDLSDNVPRGKLSILPPDSFDYGVAFGYSLTFEVSPDDPNLIIMGGTNLYRSTTGFTTPPETLAHIGGINPKQGLTLFDSFDYPDHGRFQGGFVFYPSNPKKALSGTYKGISVTQDITSNLSKDELVDWISLNNGYITTNIADVAFDPNSKHDHILASFQENGCWYTSSTHPKTTWKNRYYAIEHTSGGNIAIADQGKTKYVSNRLVDDIYRLDLDENEQVIARTKVTPRSSSFFSFGGKFILDPRNDNAMYLGKSQTLYRNSNLDEIPKNGTANTDINWNFLATIPQNTGGIEHISAIGVSYYPIADRLYFGTTKGRLYRIDHANLNPVELIDIFSEKGFPEEGYISDINVDPSNDKRAIVTFSNYGVISLFLTEDAGKNWVNISGNLEENPDGSGNGPSVKSTAFFGGSQGYLGSFQKILTATSTGLYYTYKLNGEDTFWYKEPFGIGNIQVNTVKTRRDGFIVAATKGKGVFSAKFPVINNIPKPLLRVNNEQDDILVTKRTKKEIDIKDFFIHSKGDPITITSISSDPGLVKTSLKSNSLVLDFDPQKKGKVNITLFATAGKEKVSQRFEIELEDPFLLYRNNEDFEVFYNFFPSTKYIGSDVLIEGANDFVIPQEESWSINEVKARGHVSKKSVIEVTKATAIIYKNDNGKPGEEIYNSGEILVTPIITPVTGFYSDYNFVDIPIEFPERVNLESGIYWLSIYAITDAAPNDSNQWFWIGSRNIIGEESYYRNEDGFFKFEAPDWTKGSVAFAPITSSKYDGVFRILGEVMDQKQNSKSNIFEKSIIVSPNPSNDSFMFSFKKGTTSNNQKITIKIYDITGKELFSKPLITKNPKITWDASKMSSGLYVAKISSQKHSYTLKIFKK